MPTSTAWRPRLNDPGAAGGWRTLLRATFTRPRRGAELPEGLGELMAQPLIVLGQFPVPGRAGLATEQGCVAAAVAGRYGVPDARPPRQAVRPGAPEPPPGGIPTTRSRPVAPRPEDPADGRRTDVVAEAGQLTAHPAVSPGRVLLRQPQHQVADLQASPRAARPNRIGPRAGDQTAMPGQRVPGVTSRPPPSPAGSSRARAARIARSAQSGSGWAT